MRVEKPEVRCCRSAGPNRSCKPTLSKSCPLLTCTPVARSGRGSSARARPGSTAAAAASSTAANLVCERIIGAPSERGAAERVGDRDREDPDVRIEANAEVPGQIDRKRVEARFARRDEVTLAGHPEQPDRGEGVAA